MIALYDNAGTCLTKRDAATDVRAETLWIDLLNPTPEEEAAIESALGIDIPTRAEMREIEASNRFYAENGAHFLTAFLIHGSDKDAVTTSNVTFILAAARLITVRYTESRAFSIVSDRACRTSETCRTAAELMMMLLETVVQRQADLIERLQDEIEKLAPQIFGQRDARSNQGRRLEVMLRNVGRHGDIASRVQESASSLHRTLLFFTEAAKQRNEPAALIGRIESASRDILSLTEHIRFVSSRTAFLLEATLGMISTEQNQIIKLFSVMAVMLMPPTLVASIYGMNFRHMPELDWPYGYPLAILAMVIAAVVPFIYFKRKGWL